MYKSLTNVQYTTFSLILDVRKQLFAMLTYSELKTS